MTNSIRFAGLRAGLLSVMLCVPTVATAAPWRLQDQLDNEHIILRGQSLLRYEALDGQYRRGRGDSEQMLIIRNRLTAGWRQGDWSVVAEFMDARQQLADDSSPISAGMVNTLEFVQTYVQYAPKQAFTDSDSLTLKVGKQVMDLGGRRLIASTRFRGSENAFAGVRADWNSGKGTDITGVYFSPVYRRPTDRDALLDNEREVDEILDQTRLYGASVSRRALNNNLTLEATALQLTEEDTAALASLDRDITTLGGRIIYKLPESPLTAELEGYYQWGDSSISTTSNQLLDHKAWYGHLDIGWQFGGDMKPRLAFLYDYASGDRDPNDNENNRFSTLYGVQPPDYGWTGIYGAFVRENLKSPGLRFNLRPHPRVALQFTWRKMDLAASKDRWVKAGLRDTTGAAGTDLGSQLNFRGVWTVVPGNLRLVAGYSNLFAGDYQENLTQKRFDTHYGFLQAIVDF